MAILDIRTFVGTIGRVGELRTVGRENRSVIDFSVATTPRRKDGDEWVDGETVWHSCSAWGRLAENIAEGWEKGDRVFVHGRAEMKAGYTNKDGIEVDAREVVVADFAGHENSFAPSTQNRKNSGGSFRSEESTPAPAKKAAAPAKKAAPKPAPAEDDLDLGMDDFDNEELPF